jgi:hypothetical protein
MAQRAYDLRYDGHVRPQSIQINRTCWNAIIVNIAFCGNAPKERERQGTLQESQCQYKYGSREQKCITFPLPVRPTKLILAVPFKPETNTRHTNANTFTRLDLE